MAECMVQDVVEKYSPFSENADVEYFFSGGGRGETVKKIRDSILAGMSFITLVGDEGAGKSMVCRMVQHEVPEHVLCVTLSSEVESFDEVVKQVFREINFTFTEEEQKLSAFEQFQLVKTALEKSGRRLLIIFDEAEKLYLATLERARKMLDKMNDQEICVQMFLAGQSLFKENLKQLLLCDFDSALEQHFELLPLEEEETCEYVRQLGAGFNRAAGKGDLFSPEICEKIFFIGKGNIRKTNKLAKKILANIGEETSFELSLDDVKDQAFDNDWEKNDNRSRKRRQIAGKQLLLFCCGICLLLFIIVSFFMGGNEKEPSVEPGSQDITVERPVKKTAGPVVEKQPEKVEIAVKIEKKEPVEKPVEAPALTGIDGKEEERSRLQPVAEIKQKKKTEPVSKDDILAGEPVIPGTNKTVKELYEERMDAGNRWLEGQSNDRFTLQLMVLESVDAEENLYKMLLSEEYAEIINQLYILKKTAGGPMLLVFYGEYSSMHEARKARNTFPVVLKRHRPYPISIQGVVEKIR